MGQLVVRYASGRGRNPSQKVAKSTYWYVVMTDCALEFYEVGLCGKDCTPYEQTVTKNSHLNVIHGRLWNAMQCNDAMQ
jgi:hypothetical protein